MGDGDDRQRRLLGEAGAWVKAGYEALDEDEGLAYIWRYSLTR